MRNYFVSNTCSSSIYGAALSGVGFFFFFLKKDPSLGSVPFQRETLFKRRTKQK